MTGQVRGQHAGAGANKAAHHHGIPIPAAEVGNSFVKQYYTMLAKDPLKLYKFYKVQSVFSRGVEGAPEGDGSHVTAVGRREIHSEILDGRSLGDVTKVDIQCVESQESRHGGVLVLVTGYLTYSSASARQHFAQTFFLDQQDEPYEGYFILNDVCRFLPGGEVNSNCSLAAGVASEDEGQQLAPKQPPPQQSPAPRHAPQQYNISTPMCTARIGTPVVTAREPEHTQLPPQAPQVAAGLSVPQGLPPQGLPQGFPQGSLPQELPPKQQEHAAPSATGHEASPMVFHEEDDEVPSPIKTANNHDMSSAALAAMVGAELEEQPKTWASLAATLRQGGGQLAPSKVQGYAVPAVSSVPKAAKPVLPPPGSKAGQVAPASPAAAPAAAPASSSSQPSSSSGAIVAGEGLSNGEVKLWLSRIPVDLQSTENQEVLDCLTGLLEGPSHGRVVEIVRKETSRDWAHVAVSSQEVADTIVQASKDRKILLRGKSLKAEYERLPRGGGRGGRGGGSEHHSEDRDTHNVGGNSRRRGGGGGRGRGGESAADGREEHQKATDKPGVENRPHRRGGGKGGGGKS